MTANYTISVTVTRPAGTDQYGNPLPGLTHTVGGCICAPAGSAGFSAELNTGQATVVDTDTIYAPYGADVEAADIITMPPGGALTPGTYAVDGRPANYRNPFTGARSGTVVRLQHVTG